VTISHFWMLVKILKWLDGLALEAFLKTDHARTPVL
jgi:hypothetical protein